MPNESTNGPIDHLRIRQEVSEFQALPPSSRAQLSTLACHTSSHVDTGVTVDCLCPSVCQLQIYPPFKPHPKAILAKWQRLRLQVQTTRFRPLLSHFQTLRM